MKAALAIALISGAQPAIAQSFEESAKHVRKLLTYSGPPISSGVTDISFQIASDCSFQMQAQGEMNGVAAVVNQNGTLSGLAPEDVTLQETATRASLRFDITEARDQWSTKVRISNNTEMYDLLIDDPDALFPMNASCDSAGCTLEMLQPEGEKRTGSNSSIHISEFLDQSDYAPLLASFQNLTALCAASAQ